MSADLNDFHRGQDAPRSGSASDEARQLIRRRQELTQGESEQIVPLRHERNLRLREPASERRAQPFHYPLGVPRLAFDEELIAAREPFSDRAEEFRSLRAELLATTFSSVTQRALAIISAEPGDGKTYLASNLAVSFSQFVGRTLLIDANLRRPRLEHVLNVKNKLGLSNLLAGEVEGEVVLPVPGLEGLHLLGAGSVMADPMQLLAGPRLCMLLEQMRDSFDFVLIDTPSNSAGPDARLIAAAAGAALVVGRQGHSRISPLRRLLSQLNMGPSQIAGVVLNQH